MIGNVIKPISLNFDSIPFYIKPSEDVKSETGKGWSYFFVFNLERLRDTFLVIRDYKVKDLRELYSQIGRKVFHGLDWSDRSILEYLNSLINLNLITIKYEANSSLFKNSGLGESLSKEDIQDFRTLFFSYHRFNEFLNWYHKKDLLGQNIDDTRVVIHTNKEGRFPNLFYYDFDFSSSYCIPQEHGDTQRFWDVFLKWGTTLGVIEKIHLNQLSEFSKLKNSLICSYLIKGKVKKINFREFIKINYSSKHLYMPHLFLDIGCKLKIAISEIERQFFEEYEKNKSTMSLERTSEVFITTKKIKQETTILFPKYKGSFISHVSIR